MATGVLVILVGEATKLGPYLTLHRKRYTARVALGVSTDTLDAEGTETARAEVPPWLTEALGRGTLDERVARALEAERSRTRQIPPAFSAIQVDGQRSYDLARAGKAVDLADRPVEVLGLSVVGSGFLEGVALPFIDVDLDVSKGYYVRSFARDLGTELGIPAHLAALRRTESGPFHIENAVSLAMGRESVTMALMPMEKAAATALPTGRLSAEGALRVRCGKRLVSSDFLELSPPGVASAWLDPDGHLVAIGEQVAQSAGEATPNGWVIHRGFVG